MVNSLAWGLLFWAIVRGRLFRVDVDAETIGRIRRAYTAGPLVYVVATLVALVQPVNRASLTRPLTAQASVPGRRSCSRFSTQCRS